MNLHVNDFMEGFETILALHKQGNSIFDMGNHPLFPTSSSQQKWRFAKSDKHIKLTDGNNVFYFEAPTGTNDTEEFPLVRKADGALHEFEKDSTSHGLAQVHRSDPGSIYFTMQEGRTNPTYTFRHVGGDNWRGVPKKRKAKSPVIHNVDAEQIKSGMESEICKRAEFNLGESLQNGMNHITNAVRMPGLNPLGAAGVGAGLGLAYDLGKRTLYNTPAENEEEGLGHTLRRVMIPAGVLGGLGAAESNLQPDVYDKWRASGQAPTQLFGNPNAH